MPVEKNTRELVLSYIEALNDKNFKLARRYVSDDMKFEGPLAATQAGDAIFVDLERMRLKYDVKKVFVEGNDGCCTVDLRFTFAIITSM